ncbi:C40 family peptidase [Amycolatopsis sp. 195334CR]|uniref:C40 family peptidase n=1 Tax=Amycolatopsis sp. 195334CR TaxID=2814588 RepID=UPI001A8C8DA8|nr:C40 family peptidase [Amycolatopsis sp. 195334CR]MBN6036612.1 C40 family peptidase [Amycolatopsis sp. 195334CR]
MANRLHRFLAGAGGRALVAVPLVGALAIGGYLLAEPESAQPVPQAAAPNPVGGGAVPAGPSTLRETAPVEAVTPAAAPNELDVWVAKLAGPLDIPPQALAAYATGELKLREERPDCHLTWVTLAGMGKAEHNHRGGSADGAIAAGRKLCDKGVDLNTGWWKAVGAYSATDGELFRQKALGNAQLYATLSLNPELATAPTTRATRFALDQIGLPYVWGGNGPDAGAAGFDCSGLTKAAYDSAGVELPRTADSQFRALGASAAEPSLGDLVFYGHGRIHHVGMYVGNGLMVNAPTEGQAIQLHSYRTRGDDYAGAARPR